MTTRRFAVGQLDERRSAGRAAPAMRLGDRLLRPEAQVGRDLVVAGARGVQPAGGRADDLASGAPRRSCGRLRGARPASKSPLLDLVADLQQAGEDRLGVAGRDDALLAQHAGVGDRAAHVLEGESLVDGQRGRVGVDDRARVFARTGPPRASVLQSPRHSSDGPFYRAKDGAIPVTPSPVAEAIQPRRPWALRLRAGCRCGA